MSHTVILDGVDISAQILPNIDFLYQESSATTGTVVYDPLGPPDTPSDLIGKPVTVDWNGTRIFTGEVNNAEWDPRDRRFTLRLSDLLQNHFEALDETAILAAIPGSVYSIQVFGEREDGWQQAMDCMTTVPSDAHFDRNGLLEVSDWLAKGTADFSYSSSSILNDGEYSLKLFKIRELQTQRKITYEYRLSRWKFRQHGFLFDAMDAPELGNGGWCTWMLDYTFQLPTKEGVTSAAQGTGWEIYGFIDWKLHPESFSHFDDFCGTGTGPGNPGTGWSITDELREQQILGASWIGVMRWAQTIEETYEITLNCSAAQANYGILVGEDSIGYAVEADDAGHEKSTDELDFTWSTDSLGDYFEDQESEADRVNDLTCLMQIGSVLIHHHLRKNYVTFDIELEPTLGLDSTVYANTSDFEIQGKVSELRHIVTSQRAITRVTVAIARGGGGVSDALAVPVRPDTSPSHAAPPNQTTILTQVGGYKGAGPYDPAWEQETGYVTNLQQAICVPPDCPDPDEIYTNIAFRVQGPDIEDEARDEVLASSATTYEVAIPDDLFVLK